MSSTWFMSAVGGSKAKGELKSIEYSGPSGCWVANLKEKKVSFDDTTPGEEDKDGWYQTSHHNITTKQGWKPKECVGGSCREGELRFHSGTLKEYTEMTEVIKNMLIAMDIKGTLEKNGHGTHSLNVDAMFDSAIADGNAAAAEAAQKGAPEATVTIPEVFHGIYTIRHHDGHDSGIVIMTENKFTRDSIEAELKTGHKGGDTFEILYGNSSCRSSFEMKNGKVIEHNKNNGTNYECTLRCALPLANSVQGAMSIPEMFHGIWKAPHGGFIITISANQFTRDNMDATILEIIDSNSFRVQYYNSSCVTTWKKQKKGDSEIFEHNEKAGKKWKWTLVSMLPELS